MQTRLHQRLFAAFGACCCAAAVALSAYAAHAPLDALAKARLETAVFHLVVHGLALTIFAPRQRVRAALFALASWSIGIVAFCGSLVAAAFLDAPTRLAPFGGVALIAGWLLQALAFLRR